MLSLFFTIFVICILILCLTVSIFYLIRFARIILAVQETLEEAIQNFEKAEQALKGLLEMQLFFDAPEVRFVTKNALVDVNLALVAVRKSIRNFTKLSKQQYEMVEINAEPEQNSEEK